MTLSLTPCESSWPKYKDSYVIELFNEQSLVHEFVFSNETDMRNELAWVQHPLQEYDIVIVYYNEDGKKYIVTLL